MAFELTKDYLTGIEQLDKEHEKLIQIINDTIAVLKEDTVDIQQVSNNLVLELTDYVITHFRHEEAYMKSIDDPELSLQKKEHEIFINHVNQIPIDDSLKVTDLEETLEFLVRWLFRHILHSDMMIGKVQPSSDNTNDPFAFTNKYKTSIDFIDKEHEKLFDIIRRANDLIQNNFLYDKYDDILDILDELRDYTENHFNHEEEYMAEINYPGLPAQQTAHNAFIKKLVNIDYSDLDTMDDNQQEYLLDMIDYLLNWLSSHIMGADKKIGEWASAHQK